MRITLLYLTLIMTLFCIWGCSMGIEEAKYKVVSKENNFEIRDYSPQIIAETIIEDNLENAGNKAFNTLFKYIQGNNKVRNKIAMTAPVSQQAATEKIKMTAPVEQKPVKGGWAVSFTMPASYTMETIPEPNDPKVKIRQNPACRMAAVRYSGRWTEQLYKSNLKKLDDWVNEKGYIPNGEPVWARYNPPFTLWFLRRNEILIPVKTAPRKN